MNPKKRPIPTGFTCDACKRQHKFPTYVYAHWDTPLEVKCECGRVFDLFRGEATHYPKKK